MVLVGGGGEEGGLTTGFLQPSSLLDLNITSTVQGHLRVKRAAKGSGNKTAGAKYMETAKPMTFALSHTLVPTSGTISSKTSGTLLLSLPSKANSRYFSSQNISVKQHCLFTPISLYSVCVYFA